MSFEAVEFHGARVFADPTATHAAYVQSEAEYRWCDCCTCRNIQPVLESVLEQEVLDLLATLGVHDTMPSEAIYFGREAPDAHIYEVIYHLFGKIDGGEPRIIIGGTSADVVSNFDLRPGLYGYFCNGYFPHKSAFSAPGAIFVGFTIHGVPWVIEHEEPK